MRSNQAYQEPKGVASIELRRQRCANNQKDDTHMAQEAYFIRVKGHLGQQWNEWFDGFTITNVEHGEAIISGINVDQSALHSALMKVRDLGLPLLGVSRMEEHENERQKSLPGDLSARRAERGKTHGAYCCTVGGWLGHRNCH